MPTSEVIKLKNVRLSFPRLFTPRAFRAEQDPRYEATFLLDPSDKAHVKIIEVIEFTAAEIAAEEWPKSKGKIPAAVELCYGLSEDDKKKAEYDGYEGMFYLSASTKQNNPPGIFTAGREELKVDPKTGAEPKIPYAGCTVNGTITLWTMDNEFGKRINANLRLVQFVRDGEAFGAKAPDVSEELDILDDEEDGDDFLED